MENFQPWDLSKAVLLGVHLFDGIGLVSPGAAHLVVPLGRHLEELEVELLHVRPLEAAGLLLAAVLVDAVL